MSDRHATAPADRRDFLFRIGAGAGVAALTAQAAASLRSLVPNVSYDAPTTVKLGPPADFPDGLTYAIPFDTTDFVQVSIREVLKTLGEAMVLAGR